VVGRIGSVLAGTYIASAAATTTSTSAAATTTAPRPSVAPGREGNTQPQQHTPAVAPARVRSLREVEQQLESVALRELGGGAGTATRVLRMVAVLVGVVPASTGRAWAAAFMIIG
jgi:hypothetical protein